MIEWRDRGYVPDSDEEEIGFSNDSQSPRRKESLLEHLPATTDEANPVKQIQKHGSPVILGREGDNESVREEDEGQDNSLFTREQCKVVGDVTASEAGNGAEHGFAQWLDSQDSAGPLHKEINDGRKDKSSVNAGGLAAETSSQQLEHHTGPEHSQDTILMQSFVSGQPAGEGGYAVENAGVRSRNNESAADAVMFDVGTLMPDTSSKNLNAQDLGLGLQSAARNAHDVEVSNSTFDEGGEVVDLRHVLDILASERAPARTFRARKAIQLHPYLVESEQYRHSLRARGIRPVQVTTNRRSRSASEDVQMRQDQATQSTLLQQSQSSIDGGHSSQDLFDVPTCTPQLSPRLLAADDDDLPDIDRLARTDIAGHLRLEHKRRKLNTVRNSTLGKSNHRGSIADGIDASNMPSPPPTSDASDGAPKSIRRAAFKLPRRMSSGQLPTPMTSATRRLAPRIISSPSSDSETDSEAANFVKVPSAVSVASVTSDESSDSEQSESQLKQVRKKIKGVLPASWLKLDQKARKAPPSPLRPQRQPLASPSRRFPQKGIAQRKIRPTSSRAMPDDEIGSNARILISNDSDASDDNSSATETPVQLRQTILGAPRGDLILNLESMPSEDRMEDDWIDPMLSTSAPARNKSTARPKTHKKLSDGFLAVGHDAGSARSKAGTASRKRFTESRPSSRGKHATLGSRQRSIPRLSIVDASRAPANTPKDQPQFLRLATRLARSHADQGRHSPTSKSIRLATNEDTQDALGTLREWRAGSIHPVTQKRTGDPSYADASTPGLIDSTKRSMGKPHTPMRELGVEPRLVASSESRRNIYGAAAHQNGQRAASGILSPGIDPNPGKPKVRVRREALRGADPSLPATSRACDRGDRKAAAKEAVARRPIKQPSALHGRVRTGQLETLASNFPVTRRSGARDPPHVRQLFARGRYVPVDHEFQLLRFLEETQTHQEPVEEPTETRVTAVTEPKEVNPRLTLPHRSRKSQPKRLDVGVATYRQPSEPLPVDEPTTSPGVAFVDPVTDFVHGLDPYGTRYATDFDIHPLELGTYFQQNTFVGSGDFENSLKVPSRDLHKPSGRIMLRIGDTDTYWSAWNEDVSEGLASIIRASTEGIEIVLNVSGADAAQYTLRDVARNIDYLLRSVVRYCSECLYFVDPADKRPCIDRLGRFLDEFMDMVEDYSSRCLTNEATKSNMAAVFNNSLLYLACISGQLIYLSRHDMLERDVDAKLEASLRRFCQKVVGRIVAADFSSLRSFYEENMRYAIRQTGIPDNLNAAKGLVILNHITATLSLPGLSLSSLLAEHWSAEIQRTSDARLLDQIWYNLFTVQPVLEVDVRGVFRPRSRYDSANDSWQLVRGLLQRVFSLYPASAASPNPSLNDYVRCTLVRVHFLITRWGWYRCEAVLGTIYDFFAKNGLSQLVNEESRGSPYFLTQLDKQPSLAVEPEDCSFHIFLKMLATGLIHMHGVYKPTKIRGIAWRFIPNHGRTYRKDLEVRQVDIDALRNHHDLLCTLYWASPSGHRPRLSVLQQLVDHAASHREACRLNVRAWSNVAKYQLSRAGEEEDIDVLAAWLHDMISTTVSQYRLARSEAENQYHIMRSESSTLFSPETLQSIISSNQRQIAATLLDIVAAVRQTLVVTRIQGRATRLLDQSHFTHIFQFFDAEQLRTFRVVKEALEVVLMYMKLPQVPPRHESQSQDEESQDYGDVTFLEEAVTGETTDAALSFLVDPVMQLVSNCFGADTIIDDDLLSTLVDFWTVLAQRLVTEGSRDWPHYLDAYSSGSWFQLRDTAQRRTYTPYILSAILELDPKSFREHEVVFLGAWLVSLLERESTLKFQHHLTSSLLNAATDHAVLQNLPFAVERQTGRFEISLTEIRERRLALIASILSNMHTSIEDAMYSDPQTVMLLRRDYSDILRQAMAAMRRNYEDIQSAHSTNLGGDATQGAYVTLVQQVVAFMQQYTSDILAVDRFFTDSAAFPLPAVDPTYVVGRLRSYASKLVDSKARKQLVVFVQTVSERAAAENQQAYLVRQMHATMTGSEGDVAMSSRPLRHIFMTALIPAYVDIAFSTACGWILALPFIEASTLALRDMLYDLSLDDNDNVDACIADVKAILCIFRTELEPIFEDAIILSQSHILRLVAASYCTIEAAMVFSDYIDRATDLGNDLVELLSSLERIGECISTTIQESDGESISNIEEMALPNIGRYKDARDFCTKELRAALTNRWRVEQGDYFVVKGGVQQQVRVDLGDVDEEKECALRAIASCRRSYEKVFGPAGRRSIVNGAGMAEIFL